MSHFEKKLSGKRVFEGRIISVDHDEVLLEDGSLAMREVVTHPGGVAVLAAENGYAYFVRQFRYCFGKELLEIPAGKLEPGEDPEKAARRELMEETGFHARGSSCWAVFSPAPVSMPKSCIFILPQALKRERPCQMRENFLPPKSWAFRILPRWRQRADRGRQDPVRLCAGRGQGIY